MKKNLFSLLLAVLVLAAGCKDDQDAIDTEYPEIILTASNTFPVQCSTIKRGESFTVRILLRDNMQLGSYSLDIHHNFDQHTHSTEVEECTMEAVKTPVTPFLFIRNYPIPEGLREYQAATEIEVPADVDPGDYHFLIRVTDKEGWQTLKGLSIKIE
ncbi:DUF4625 domain-containing protein [Pontibacter sp. SGAir0037]|uniref:DUF4625 domain-containing protein n=1 Tax=Pontibacter sp. SGAir0037 TaxID=2571030 RepID=UPI0010CCC42E|nr:DUF4625 domain-containing protein [Pontibacter sp. SGAir0037]QCR21724.1 hypothetical protein C1N53_04785 [Pontibacter sp. SGAir0037]